MKSAHGCHPLVAVFFLPFFIISSFVFCIVYWRGGDDDGMSAAVVKNSSQCVVVQVDQARSYTPGPKRIGLFNTQFNISVPMMVAAPGVGWMASPDDLLLNWCYC